MKIRFWPALIVVAVILVTTRLGFWQLSRAHQREALNAHLTEFQHATPIAVGPQSVPLAAIEYHRVVTHGTWMPERVVYLDNRPYKDAPGFYVVMPLKFADGSAVLVNRGWLPRSEEDRTKIAPYATPAGDVEVVGLARANASQAFALGQSGAEAHQSIRQNLAVDAYARETGLRLQPFVIQQDDGARDGLVRDWPTQVANAQQNYGYMVQWWAMAVAALAFGLYAARRAALHERRAPVAEAPETPDTPEIPNTPDKH
ncbi:SURF1 family protein [Pararobbsia silviterrae]|uniref:SURF1 family protein n=1 Tax=Pararobbsia silviterrae TaxID=1792498 RepID=UPI001F0CC6FC|nr:SURF1 family protein [Pararobbsia silviterrae]